MQLNFAMTTVPTIALWIVGLIIFGVGALLGYFNMNIEARKKLEAMETNTEILRAEAERKLEAAERKLEEAQLLRAQTPGASVDPGLLRIKSDKTIEMDGVPLSAATFTADKKKRLIELISLFRPFLDAPVQAPRPAQPTISPPTVPPAAQVTPPTPPALGSSLLGVPAAAAAKKDPEKEFKLLSIVQQIDTVLQKRMEGTPLEGQGIRLADSPAGAVEVYIGIQKFDSIDDVPDDAVKKAIRAAIAEWEQKYVPGL
ncbi:MAG: hypothetical protein DPW18_17935 [Chloroflexi bacterium]|nr:hypothetical protein [Chloroflexota bacterium]MDL1944009.1 hypothetical protein [Chloroflexi bacterium CFX2]